MSASRDSEELQACAGPEVSPYSPPLKVGYVHPGPVTFRGRPAPLCRAPGLLRQGIEKFGGAAVSLAAGQPLPHAGVPM